MDISSLISAIGTVITAMATIILAYVTRQLYVATQNLSHVSREMNAIAQSNAQAQADAMLINSLNAQNALVLSEDRNLRIANHLIVHEELDQTDEASRERYMAFVMLNVQQLMFMQHKQGQFSDQLWQVNAEQVLDRMLMNETVRKLLETRGYHPDFVKHCTERAAILRRQQGASQKSVRDPQV